MLDLKEMTKDSDVPVKPLDFPFPVKDVITRPFTAPDGTKYGPLEVPWLHNSNEVRRWGIQEGLLIHG